MSNSLNIALCAFSSTYNDVATALAEQLSIPLIDCSSINLQHTPTPWQLLLSLVPHQNSDYRLELQFPGQRLTPLFVDFHDPRLQHRQQFGGGRQQAIAKAVGLKHGWSPHVVDATAGLGRDAFVLASLGCRVHMLERKPVIHALLQDGMRRLTNQQPGSAQLIQSLTLTQADSLLWLQTGKEPVDVVYLDPMYPHRSKSALVKKEMRVLRQLVGDDLDITTVLESALDRAKNRVVVKRPKTAVPIGQRLPTHSIESKNTRFDVYLKI